MTRKALLASIAISLGCLAASAGGAGAQTPLNGSLGFNPYSWGSYVQWPWWSMRQLGAVELAQFPPKDTSRFGSANGFFEASQYGADCSDPVYIVNMPGGYYRPTYSIEGYNQGPYSPPKQVHACRATQAPVVDASFLDRLRASGADYHLAYPIQNHGNGRAYVVWVNFNGSRSLNTPYLENTNFGTIATLGPAGGPGNPAGFDGMLRPAIAGYARIEGVGWEDQFKSYTNTPINTAGGNVTYGTPVTIAHGDQAGDFIASLASPRRETTLRLATPVCYIEALDPCHFGYEVTMVTDDWLAGTPPPPPPPLSVPLAPPPAPPPASSANPTNSGGPGAASGAGTGTASAHDEQGAAFQWEAYCRSPNPDGSQRPQGWVDNCLATRH